MNQPACPSLIPAQAEIQSASPRPGLPAVEWMISSDFVPYLEAVASMERRVSAITAGEATEAVWLLEHPPLYTAGTSAKSEDLLSPSRFPVFTSGRGGQHTYHGPGQRIAYVMLDLNRRGRDIRAFVAALEGWLIATLAEFGIVGETRRDRVGVWVQRSDGMGALHKNSLPLKGGGLGWGSESKARKSNSDFRFDPPPDLPPFRGEGKEHAGFYAKSGMQEDKIAALGIRVRKWVSFHGVALNIDPDLSHYDAIVPCGLSEYGVTSMAALGVKTSMEEVDAALKRNFEKVF